MSLPSRVASGLPFSNLSVLRLCSVKSRAEAVGRKEGNQYRQNEIPETQKSLFPIYGRLPKLDRVGSESAFDRLARFGRPDGCALRCFPGPPGLTSLRRVLALRPRSHWHSHRLPAPLPLAREAACDRNSTKFEHQSARRNR